MTTSLNKKIDKAIANYLNKAEVHTKSRNLSWIALAWSIYEECCGNQHKDWRLIREKLPESAIGEDLSLRKISDTEEAEALISNPVEVINTICRYYSTSPFAYYDTHADEEIVACFMAKMANPQPGETIYLPFAGIGIMTDYLPESSTIGRGEEIDPVIWSLAKIRSNLHGAHNFSEALHNEDSFAAMESGMEKTEGGAPGYDVVIMSPPYTPEKGEKYPSEEPWHKAIRLASGLLKSGGRIIAAIPSKFLSRTIDKLFISGLLEEKSIRRVAEIKSVAEDISRWHRNKSVSILEITRTPSEEIALYDIKASDPGFAELTGTDLGIAVEKYLCQDSCPGNGVWRLQYQDLKNKNLSPSYYTAYHKIFQSPHISIRSCISPIPTAVNPTTEAFPIVEMRDLSKNYLDCDIHMERLHLQTASKSRNLRTLKQSAILVGFPMSTGFVVGKLHLEEGQEVLLGHNVFPFSINGDKVNLDYLLKELTSAHFLELYNHICTSIIQRKVSAGFLDLIIPLPDIDSQFRIVLDDARNSLSQKQSELIGLNKKHLTEIRLRKHTLASKISTFAINWENLYDMLHENKGNIDLEENGDWLSKMDKAVKTIARQINQLTQTREDFGESVPINPDVLIDSYCENAVKMERNYLIHRYVPTDSRIKICIPPRAFDRIMENIVNNAVSHGFTDPSRKDYAISIQTVVDDRYVYIEVSNNGNPLSSKITPEDVLLLGHSTMMYHDNHEGQGGYDVQHIMEMFSGEASIISTPELEYTVTYRLKFRQYEPR